MFCDSEINHPTKRQKRTAQELERARKRQKTTDKFVVTPKEAIPFPDILDPNQGDELDEAAALQALFRQ